MDYSYLFKYIIIGDMGVGKSCLMMQFIEGKFRENHDITIGVEFGTRRVTYNGKTIKLQIWDTAGQENFRSLTRSYYKAAVGALLVYDVTRRDSFVQLEKWINEVKENTTSGLTLLLIGNKNDCEEERQVSFFEGDKFAKDNNLIFLETSAKTGDGVEKAFNNMTDIIYHKLQNGEIDITNENCGVKLGSEGTLSRNNSIGGESGNATRNSGDGCSC